MILGGDVTTTQQPTPVPAPVPASQQQELDRRHEFAKRAALAAIGGAVSGTARALWGHMLDGDA
jgi:hypothetical protein